MKEKPMPPVWPSSITGRLIALNTVSAVVLLSLATIFLYSVRASDLQREDNQLLADEVRLLRLILLELGSTPQTLEEAISLNRERIRIGRYSDRILDESGRILVEKPGMSDTLPVALFPEPTGVGEDPEDGIKWRSAQGRTYLLTSAWAASGDSRNGPKILQVALDISKGEALIAKLRRWLLIVFSFGVAFSATAAVIVARRGMRPITGMAQAAQAIKATHLHERIGTAQWPDELKTLALAFDNMLDRLEDSFKRLSQFSADLAHELRTPINNLMGEAEVALIKTRDAEELRKVIESGMEEYARLSRIIDSLLFLARAESTEMEIRGSELDIRKEIEAVMEFHDPVAKEQGIGLGCQGHATLITDAILFRRLISNLLSNALQYTPRGGTVAVSIIPIEDQWVEIRVRDTGVGIAPEHLPKIFDRFYRADPARSPSPHGTGLGLAIVKSIMDLHGGTVSIESVPSKGTTVTLRFPAHAPAPPGKMSKM